MHKLPFWINQLGEYALGLGLISQAIQGPSATVPVLMGATILVSAAVADGPLAGWRAVSRPTHRIVDIVLAVVALGLAVLPWSGADVAGRAVLVLVAGLLGLLILRTNYAAPVARAPRSRGEVAEDMGRSAGRLVGRGVKAYETRRPPGPPPGP